ncbi:putative olfactory receptor 3A4 [Lepisosteus oculatus]|uniref:putative olfactory receptor 3A4 n=1 Tax=Lepisosteus oculatus TaxID=7918 RepID=UPI003712F265
MSYERLVSICFPLRSSTINTNVTMFFIIVAFITISYVCIIAALTRIASAQGRWKAFKTCTAHLALVAIFFIPFLWGVTAVFRSSGGVAQSKNTSKGKPGSSPKVHSREIHPKRDRNGDEE